MTENSAAPSVSDIIPARLYTPSWFDRFTDWVDSLSVSVTVFYGIFTAILIALHLVMRWDGALGSVYAFPLMHTASAAYVLILLHYLDKVAARSLERFRPLLSIGDEEYTRLRFRLTTMPARPLLVATLIGVGYGLLALKLLPSSLRVQALHLGDVPPSRYFDDAITLVISGLVGVMVYHTLHQLRIVRQIYKLKLSIDLYQLPPLYAFSTLSAATAVGVTFLAYIWYLLAPQLINVGSTVTGVGFLTCFSFLTFVVPLWGAHRLLVEEKARRLSENGKRLRAAITELHRRMDTQEIADMDNLNKMMASLELEHTTLARISTWPWNQETFRGVAAALFFPVIVWLSQWILERALG